MGSLCERTSHGVWSGGHLARRGDQVGHVGALRHRHGVLATLLRVLLLALGLAALVLGGDAGLFLLHEHVEEVEVASANGGMVTAVVQVGELGVRRHLAGEEEGLADRADVLFAQPFLHLGELAGGVDIGAHEELQELLTREGHLELLVAGELLHRVAEQRALDPGHLGGGGDPTRLRLATTRPVERLGVGDDTLVLSGTLGLG